MTSPTETLTYSVESMSCGHCVNAITGEVSALAGVAAVAIDLATKKVMVTGDILNDFAIRAAIVEAGFEPSA